MGKTETATENTPPRRLLLVDDDEAFAAAMARALGRRGVAVTVAHNTETALAALDGHDAALVDLRLGQDSGLRLVAALRERRPALRIVVLTGYASIATAVEAIKLGAVQYLTKPAEPDDVLRAFGRTEPDPDVPPPEQPMSVRRLEWEHIERVLAEHGGNISAAARALGMHRRTLQRKLRKRPVKR